MKRLHIAVLWLFAVGFSSTSYAEWPPCYMTTGPSVVTLSETPVSREQCLALYEARHEATRWPDETLASSYGDEYYCPSAGTWIYFPCGAKWTRTYVTADPIQHPLYAGGVDYVYWQGIPRNISLSLDYAKAPAESTTVLRSVEPGSGEIMLKVTAIDDNTKLPYLGTPLAALLGPGSRPTAVDISTTTTAIPSPLVSSEHRKAAARVEAHRFILTTVRDISGSIPPSLRAITS